MRVFLFAFSVCCLLHFPSVSQAQSTVIWDQQPLAGFGVLDQETILPLFNSFVLNDVEFANPATLDEVTVYFSNEVGEWPNIVTEARLSLFASDFTPFEPSLDGEIVPVDVVDMGNGVLAITASGLNAVLEPGVTWVGLSPLAPLAITQEFRLPAKLIGAETVARNPGGGFDFGFGTEWYLASVQDPTFLDSAMTLVGSIEMSNGGRIDLDSLTVFRGISVSGEINDLLEDNDQRLIYQPGFTINSDEAPVWLIFNGTEDAGEVDTFNLESHAGTPGLTVTIEEFNFATGAYDVVLEESELFGIDILRSVQLTGHTSGADELRTRAGWRRTGFTINFPWEVMIDQAFWISN